jgi:hypothetical protein
MDPTYELPDEELPEEMQTLDGLEDTDNWPDTGEFVRIVDSDGDIREGSVYDRPEDDIMTVKQEGANLIEPKIINTDNVNLIVEIL